MSEDDPEAWAREKEEIAHAWQQPAFSHETIETDQWTAVYLPIPENASRELLEYAHGWAADLERYAEHDGAFVRPMAGSFEDRPQQENIEAARERVEVLGWMIGEQALQELATVDADKAGRVRDLLVEVSDMHSLHEVHWTGDGFAVVRSFEIDNQMLSEYGLPAQQEVYRADTIDALGDKFIAAESWRIKAESSEARPIFVAGAAEIEAMSIRDGEAAEVAPEAPVRGFFSVWNAAENLVEHSAQVIERFLDVAENAGERLARVADITLGAVIGYFVDEPKMTAAQVHDTLQAAGNVETVHAREVAAAEAIEAGAHETRMLEMKGEQQTRDLELGAQIGTNGTAEANLGLDAYEPQRRKQSQSL